MSAPTSPSRAFPYGDEPWAGYYLHQNPGWDQPTDGYSRWKLATSRKRIAIDTWDLREAERERYEARHGDPETWTTSHPTVVMWATNCPTPVCLRCEWIDDRYWDEPGALAGARLHTLEQQLSERS